MPSTVASLAVLPNGDLVAGGSFKAAGGVIATYIARWDGTSWGPFGAGMDNSVAALAVLTNGDLAAGGTFTTAGGPVSAHLARWREGAPPAILAPPTDQAACSLASAKFSVDANGLGMSFRWQREFSPGSFVDLLDGSTNSWDGDVPGIGGMVSGATTETVTIAADLTNDKWLSPAHAVRYRCVVSNACGSANSDSAQLSVCMADYDCNSFVNGIDFDTFIADFEAGVDAADVNHDGFVNGVDFDTFADHFVAGC